VVLFAERLEGGPVSSRVSTFPDVSAWRRVDRNARRVAENHGFDGDLSVVILPTATPTCVQNLKSLALAVVEILHGVQNSKASYLTLTTPLSGKIFLRQGGTCYDKLMYPIRSL